MNMKKAILGLLLTVCVSAVNANAMQSATTCDRECLRGKVTQLLYAFLKHDVSGLPVADTLRVTEDAVEKPLAKVGLVTTVTRLRGFRQDIIDERAGVAGADVIVEETGAPVLLVVRVKVVANKLTEVELVATRGRAEGLIFNIDGLSAPSEVMNYTPRPEQLSSRDDAIKAAMHYPTGLNAAKTFADVNAPFAANAYRYENGQIMAGPDCKFARGCENISTQSLQIFQRLGDVQTRVVAVDERMGIVWLRMAWGVREKGGDQLTVWESFKVFDGKIHAVEAFMRILPFAQRNGGWQ
jgi:DNA-binding protein Fis